MRRGLTWLAGLVGIAALLRRRSRRRAAISQSPATPPAPTAPDPVVELRQKLDDTRAADPSSEEAATLSLDERRARVHERAQDAISLMDSPAHDPSDEGDSD